MAPPAFVLQLLGFRRNGIPNNADKESRPSIEIAAGVLELIGSSRATTMGGQKAGSFLEHGVRDLLARQLPVASPQRRWSVAVNQRINRFEQYSHLADLDDLIRADPSGTLSASIGRDYNIKPDAAVGIETSVDALPFLHASVSCKFTIRSDRVQNIRHEGVILTRHRRGRQPHVVAVTSEPLPTRLASIARGTGEIDAVYHVALPELIAASDRVGGPEQQHVLEELVGQRRLLDLNDLPRNLTIQNCHRHRPAPRVALPSLGRIAVVSLEAAKPRRTHRLKPRRSEP